MAPALLAALPMLMGAGKGLINGIAGAAGAKDDEEEARRQARMRLSNQFQEQTGGRFRAQDTAEIPKAQTNPIVGGLKGAMEGAMGGAVDQADKAQAGQQRQDQLMAMQGQYDPTKKPEEESPFLSMARGYLGRM